jgi:7-cyano-7-deazaguanine synthase
VVAESCHQTSEAVGLMASRAINKIWQNYKYHQHVIFLNTFYIPVSVMSNNNNKALVLASGGIDSTACVKFYQDLGFEVQGFFIDYGQRARQKEWESVQKIAAFYKIEIKSMTVQNPSLVPLGEIKGRNAFLIMAAILSNPDFVGLISLGIHAGVPYYDCSKDFLKKTNVLVTDFSDGQIKIDAPFIDWDKKMIVSYCRDFGIPIHLTYSCENGDEPCGKCLSCLDRSALNVS